MKRTVVIGLASLAFAGCANLNSIHQTANLPDGKSHLIDAKQRAIMVWPTTTPHTVATVKNRGKPGGPPRIVSEDRYSDLIACAEPSPDAFSVLATSGEFSLTGQTGAAAAGSLASTETGASLVRRTTTIQALRDAYFRLCEAHANGAIDDIDLMIGQRHNQTMLLGMLAVEQLTGAMAAPAVAIGGSAQAVSASSMQAIGAAYAAELKKKPGLEKAESEAKTAHETAAQNLKTHKESPRSEKDTEKAEWDRKSTDLETKAGAAKTAHEAAVADKEVNAELIAAYSKMLKNASETGSMAQSALPIVFPSSATGAGTSTQAQIAETVRRIVETLNANDFGPTVCMSVKRNETTATNAVCADIMEQYVAALAGRARTIQAGAAFEEARVEILKALGASISKLNGQQLNNLVDSGVFKGGLFTPPPVPGDNVFSLKSNQDVQGEQRLSGLVGAPPQE